MAKTFRVTYKTIVYNTRDIEAENIDEARELADEEIGELDLYEGEVTSQEIESIIKIH